MDPNLQFLLFLSKFFALKLVHCTFSSLCTAKVHFWTILQEFIAMNLNLLHFSLMAPQNVIHANTRSANSNCWINKNSKSMRILHHYINTLILRGRLLELIAFQQRLTFMLLLCWLQSPRLESLLALGRRTTHWLLLDRIQTSVWDFAVFGRNAPTKKTNLLGISLKSSEIHWMMKFTAFWDDAS